MESLKAIFDQIQVSSSKIEPVTDTESNVTILKTQTETSISPEVFDNLCNEIEKIRNEIVQ